MDLQDLIQNSLDKREKERKEYYSNKAIVKRLKKENGGYNVQYIPCGHFREIQWDEFELVEKAKKNKKVDAISLSSSNCPLCGKEIERFKFFTPEIMASLLMAYAHPEKLVNLAIIGKYSTEYLEKFPTETVFDFAQKYVIMRDMIKDILT